MSHLLYLHSFDPARFVNVFGAGNQAYLDDLISALPAPLATSQARAALTNAVHRGLVGKLPAADRKAVDWAVQHAITTKKFGVNRKPISPMGAGGGIFDGLSAAFEEAGATKQASTEGRRG